MKKLNFLMGLGLFAASVSAQAQKTIASVGFESGDSKYTTSNAYTPGGTYGDWINKQGDDQWNEQYKDDVHSGEYAFVMNNTDSYEGNTWDRGFKIGNLHLKENTSYRVSFWVKADEVFINADGTEKKTQLKSSLSIGREYCDMPITTKSGLQYYYNYTSGMTGEWRHISYMTFFTNKDDQDAFSINYTGKEDPNGNIPVPQSDPFPDEYFVTINMYNPGQYVLDDIKVEEDVTFNEASFTSDAIKLDFGYPTNIAELAKAEGSFSLDVNQVKVTVNGTAVTPAYLEGKEDGFLYIFFNDEVMKEGDKVEVSFTPAADCPIVYNNNRRPSADVETEMIVLGFANEVAIYNPAIDAIPAVWSAPKVVSTTPENESFNLDNKTFSSVSFTYDKPVTLQYANATISWSDNFGNHEEDLGEEDLKLSEDKMTVTIDLGVGSYEDGEYTVTIYAVENEYGQQIAADGNSVSFALGQSSDDSVSEEIYVTDFDHEMTDGVPQGWYTYAENINDGVVVPQIHLYGFNDEERTSQYNYSWGGTPGGGGARLYDGFSGDFIKGFYWCSRNTDIGYASYGELIKDYIQPDGTLAEDTPEGIALKLEPRKYRISFLMAAWKNEPTFTFTLEDLNGNVYAKFEDILASPNMNGQTTKVTGSVKCDTDFSVDKEGYYVLKFTANPAQWQEFLLANLKLITMPSKAAYYNNLLNEALIPADSICTQVAFGDEYNGETKSALEAVIKQAKETEFHSGTAILAVIDKLNSLSAALETRCANIDDYAIACVDGLDAIDALEDKYANTQMAKDYKAYIEKYQAINPSTLSDDELNEITPKLKDSASAIANIKGVIDAYTWGIYKGMQSFEILGGDVISNAVYNKASQASTNDRAIAEAINAEVKGLVYNYLKDHKTIIEDYTTYVNKKEKETEDGDLIEGEYTWDCAGIELTGYVNNPKLYREYNVDGVPGWTIEALGTNEETGEPNTVNIAYDGTAPTATMPATDMSIGIYGNPNYKISQVIEGVPAGIYAIKMSTRTYRGTVTQNEEDVDVYYNAQNDETQEWDKYIFANGVKVPYKGGSWGYGSDANNTIIENVTVGADGILTLGAQEYYTSGKAFKNDETGSITSFWEGTTYFDDIRIFLTAPLEGFDYATAASAVQEINANANATITDVYNVSGAKVAGMQKGINIIKYSNGSVRKVLVK